MATHQIGGPRFSDDPTPGLWPGVVFGGVRLAALRRRLAKPGALGLFAAAALAGEGALHAGGPLGVVRVAGIVLRPDEQLPVALGNGKTQRNPLLGQEGHSPLFSSGQSSEATTSAQSRCSAVTISLPWTSVAHVRRTVSASASDTTPRSVISRSFP